jgi:hypothetical protein
LFLSAFNLAPNAKLDGLAEQVNLASAARYIATGKFVAFSEGNTGLDNPPYVYEWVVKEDGSTWTIDDGQNAAAISPIIYFKAAVGLLAMHDTPFTENMVSYIESKLPSPSSGYSDGVDENGRVANSDIDKTNGMIIQAAFYAINNLPGPTPTPTSNSTPTPSSSVNPFGTNPVGTWYVIVFIAVLLAVGCVRFVQVIIGFRKGKSPESTNLCQSSVAPFRIPLFFYKSWYWLFRV